MDASTLFQQWRLAEREADAAERHLKAARLAYASGRGPLPDSALLREATERRLLATQLLRDALEETRREHERLRSFGGWQGTAPTNPSANSGT